MMKAVWILALAVLIALAVVVIGNLPTVVLPKGPSDSRAGQYEGGGLVPGDAPTPERARPAKQIQVRKGQAYIVIDRYCNRLFLRTRDSVLLDAHCSTGSGGEVIDSATNRRWRFDTPAGVFVVDSKLANPWWRKPDWAFVEEGLPLPKNESERLDNEMMGDYAIGFGDGFFIHGTIYERLLGRSVTHGCIRLAAGDLKVLYDNTRIGTPVFIY